MEEQCVAAHGLPDLTGDAQKENRRDGVGRVKRPTKPRVNSEWTNVGRAMSVPSSSIFTRQGAQPPTVSVLDLNILISVAELSFSLAYLLALLVSAGVARCFLPGLPGGLPEGLKKDW